MWLRTTRNNDQTDLITADNQAYGHFWASMTERQRFTGTTSGMAKAGWQSMMFNSAEVVLDGGIGGSSPGHRMYFLNTKYLKWCPHKDKNMVPLDKGRYSAPTKTRWSSSSCGRATCAAPTGCCKAS